MDWQRLIRVIKDRWVVVLIGAFIGLAGALVFLNIADQEIESVFEATAPMRFDPAEGETIPDLAEAVREAREFALIAAEDLLRNDPGSRVTLNLAEAKLFFISLESTEAEAIDKATALRQSYLDVDPELGGGVDQALSILEGEALSLDAQIAILVPALTERDLALVEDQIRLDQTIAAIDGQLLVLILAEAAVVTPEGQALIVAERLALNVILDETRRARAALGPTPEPQQTATDALLLETLQARKALLNAEYQRLYLRRLGVAGLGSAELVTVENFQSEPIDPTMLAIVGFLGGAIIAAAGLLVISRTRRTVWLPRDIDVPVLGEIPARDVVAHGIEAWYDAAEGGPRKTAVQALRSAVQAQAPGGGSSIALTGYNVAGGDVQALAADLAGSMASAGDSVLMIDANLHSPVALGDFRVGGVSLAEILRLPPDAPEFTAVLDNAVEQAHVVRPNLAVIASGPPPDSPADALAGRQFRSLIAIAEARYDTTLVVVDDFGTPSAQAAMQRLRLGIPVIAPGSSTQADFNGLINDAERLRISIAGAVFVAKRRRLSRVSLRRKAEHEPTSATEVESSVTSPMTRLHNYAVPDERRSALVQHSPLGDLASTIGQSEEGQTVDAGLGAQLLRAINDTGSPRAFEAVSDYVVSRAEDMVTARYGYGDLIETLTNDVVEFGFLSLRPVRGHRTVGSWLTNEIEGEVIEWGPEVVTEVERLLSGNQPDFGIDLWLDSEFFKRHLLRTQGEPAVWHFVSQERHVSLLLPARRMSTEQFETMMTEVVGKNVDEFERKRKAALTRSDVEQAAEFERQVWDVRDFEKSLRAVLYQDADPSTPSIWNPDWLKGTRQNLAPFQHQGLLPFDVLSQQEISALSATA